MDETVTIADGLRTDEVNVAVLGSSRTKVLLALGDPDDVHEGFGVLMTVHETKLVVDRLLLAMSIATRNEAEASGVQSDAKEKPE